eukprot:5473563-Pyramimonas_sp.AAC.1
MGGSVFGLGGGAAGVALAGIHGPYRAGPLPGLRSAPSGFLSAIWPIVAFPFTVRLYFVSGPHPAYRSSAIDDPSFWGKTHVFSDNVPRVNGGVRPVSDVGDIREGVGIIRG